ncbi:MAG: valine--tRNA ligase [Candidatus Jacksonbacteria bacterium]
MKLPKAYNPQKVEDKIYALWEKSGSFQPNADHPKGDNPATFSIAMPPPNATGELHIGHAMFLTLQDLMIRYHRMKGEAALWLPGTDHASIATQNKVEKILMEKEGKTRQDLGRAVFLRRVNQYVKDSQHIIRRQIRKMGSSCDWSRERYTLDAGLTRAVQEVFVRMYNDGLIYRGDRIVNWCPRCGSTLADDEVEYKEQVAKLYYIIYKLKTQTCLIGSPPKRRNSKLNMPHRQSAEEAETTTKNLKLSNNQNYIVVATTRPETKIGDTAVAVHPEDKKYKHLIEQEFDIQLGPVQIHIKVIADKGIDPKFGSGALGVTPGHSAIDFEMAQKNNLPIIKVIDERGRILIKPYAGLDVKTGREKIVADWQKAGLIEKIENIKHNLSVCYRCGTSVEPLVSKQWFINVNRKLRFTSYKLQKLVGKSKASLKEIALTVVKSGKIKIIPKRFEKIYFHWMNNLRDWCVSRQIWFGHRMPVWYCQCNNIIVSIKKPKKCPKCGSTKLKQGTDTLDTWFSSGLWTFSTLGWPNKTDDLKRFHPTSVMETGYDILFFWVARMILMTTYALGEVPFKTVYLHGLVRDKLGRKMSKSLGNGIDPLDMIKKYGADAVRLSLIIGTTPGNDIRLYEEKIAGYRNFITKIWNIARFIMSKSKCQMTNQIQMSNMPHRQSAEEADDKFTLADKWILFELGELIKRVNRNLEKYQFSQAGEDIYKFMWHKLADWYIEAVKIEKQPHQQDILTYVLEKCLILLHPFVPFVTEEIWGIMNYELRIKNYELLIVKPWVEKIDFKISKAEAQKFIKIQQKISKKRAVVKKVNKTKQISNKELADLKKYVKSLEARLKNKAFLTKAPAQVIKKEKARLSEALSKLA